MTTDFCWCSVVLKFLQGQKGLMASLGNNNRNTTSVRRQRANFLVATSVTSSSVCSQSGFPQQLDYRQPLSILFYFICWCCEERKDGLLVGLGQQLGEFDMYEYVLTCRVCTASYMILFIRAMNWSSTVLRKRVGSCVTLAGSLFSTEIYHVLIVVTAHL